MPANTTYAWGAPTTPGITGLASGTNASAITGTLTNTTPAPIVVVYTVTPTSPTGPCSGATFTVSVTVNPTPTVNAVTSQTLCNNATTTAVNFASTFNVTGTTYAWTNNTTSIGLAASGTGNIAAFTATNTSNAPVTTPVDAFTVAIAVFEVLQVPPGAEEFNKVELEPIQAEAVPVIVPALGSAFSVTTVAAEVAAQPLLFVTVTV